MNDNEEVRYWVDFETESGELVECIHSPTSLKEIQDFTAGLPLNSEQVSNSTQDFFVAVGSQLTFDEKRYVVKRVSVGFRDAATYGEIRVFVTVEEL